MRVVLAVALSVGLAALPAPAHAGSRAAVLVAAAPIAGEPDVEQWARASRPRQIRVRAGRTTTLPLGGGARLIIPPGSVRAGAIVKATFRKAPRGELGAQDPFLPAVHLATKPASALRGLVTLEFPAPKGASAGDVGISTFVPGANSWRPVSVTFDSGRRMVIAQVGHFSWWNPFTWDWASMFATANQWVGERVGKRGPAAECRRGQPVPEWVSNVVGVSNDAAIALRGCAEGENGVLAVELQNNRPYSMYLRYGSGVKWGWHESGSSVEDRVRNAFGDRMAGPNELYLPPLGRASVGVFKFAGNRVFSAGPGYRSLSIDAGAFAWGSLIEKIPGPGPCLAALYATQLEVSAMNVAEAIKKNLDCMLKDATARGWLDSVKLNRIAALTKSLRRAGVALAVGDVTWRLTDLFVDGVVVSDSALGAGFSVFGRSDAPAPPAGGGPTPPSGGATPTAQVTVSNLVTNGGTQMREDSTPAYLSTVTQNRCRSRGCMLAGTDMGSGAVITAVCQISGDRTTNGQDNSAVDDHNPGLFTSNRWYGIRWGDGRSGYLSEVWLSAGSRGGLGLSGC